MSAIEQRIQVWQEGVANGQGFSGNTSHFRPYSWVLILEKNNKQAVHSSFLRIWHCKHHLWANVQKPGLLRPCIHCAGSTPFCSPMRNAHGSSWKSDDATKKVCFYQYLSAQERFYNLEMMHTVKVHVIIESNNFRIVIRFVFDQLPNDL